MTSYEVESYSAHEPPGERSHLKQGRYESARQALQAAQAIVEDSLRELAPTARTPDALMRRYALYGEVPVIHGWPDLPFDPQAHARRVAAEIHAEHALVTIH